MNCELCGGNIRGEPQAVNIDGGVFRVCNTCSKLGTPARTPKQSTVIPKSPFGIPPRSPVHNITSSTRPIVAQSPSFSMIDEELELRADYSRIIKAARETLGITQEELGRKINEKPSVISHLENGSLKPDGVVSKKLEHFLKIQLFIPIEELGEEGSSP